MVILISVNLDKNGVIMRKQYVFLLDENHSCPSYQLSFPSDDEKEVEKCARQEAVRQYGEYDSKRLTWFGTLDSIKSKYQIIELHIPIEKYNEWRHQLGTTSITKKERDFFLEANNLSKVINAGMKRPNLGGS